LESSGVDGWTILKWFLEMSGGGGLSVMGWIDLAQDRDS
jgi:hypothetical protein